MDFSPPVDTGIEPTVTEIRQRRYEALVQPYGAELYRYAYWLCSDKAVAEHLTQEVFHRAWCSRDSLHDATAAKNRLITILRPENARRFERYRQHHVDVELDELEIEDTACDTSTAAFVLRLALTALPLLYREPLLLQ